jgi:hypothetical protein
MGNLQRRIARDHSFSPSERSAAEAESRQWFQKSADAWNEWNRRAAATPESEIERRKVERLLAAGTPVPPPPKNAKGLAASPWSE